MDEPFKIPVTYKGRELEFKSWILRTGYTRKIKVEVDDYEVIFEPDEEGTYRAVMEATFLESGRRPDVPLLQVIADVIQNVF